LIHRMLDNTTLAPALEAADAIILAMPVGEILRFLPELAQKKLKPGVMITDVGSTKKSIVDLAERLFARDDVLFIGGHPMAGSHKSGLAAARADLFENAYYVLVPTRKAKDHEVLEELLRPTRAKFVVMEADVHDQVVAVVSHMPHLLAALMVDDLRERAAYEPWFKLLAAGGFKDMTRIAAANPVMWRDILLDNRERLISLIDGWHRQLQMYKKALLDDDGETLADLFRRAGDFRRRLPEKRSGAVRPAYDLYLDIPDQPGMIGHVTTLLGDAGINLVNIEIMELREDIMGVLRLAFRSDGDLKRAAVMLQDAGFRLHSLETQHDPVHPLS
ncbi:MAG: prephenate dehydrogenase, partial [Candidatus Carbobacillus sp.]|nr:prephenate dehydrogenase [Candidatus Carbobacillus sp.]